MDAMIAILYSPTSPFFDIVVGLLAYPPAMSAKVINHSFVCHLWLNVVCCSIDNTYCLKYSFTENCFLMDDNLIPPATDASNNKSHPLWEAISNNSPPCTAIKSLCSL